MNNTADINYFKDPLNGKTGEEAFKNRLPSILESHETEINNLDTNKLEKGNYSGTAEDLKNDITNIENQMKYYDTQNKAQMESVDNNFMRDNDPRMPLFSEKKTQVSFGSGLK